jgi:hypothetical protein
LFAANAISSEKPVVLLTDFQQTYSFFWLGYSQCETTPATLLQTPKLVIFGTKFNDIHQVATFARILLNSDQLRNASVNIQKHFPVFDKRARLTDLRSYIIPEDDDIANMDDFEQEMTSEERTSHEIRKRLKKALPLVPPAYRPYYPIQILPSEVRGEA